MLTFGSLFAGIGGLDLGLERAGMVCKWQVEIDTYCLKVLEKHWPNVRRYGDVRECGSHNLEPVDLICGGFPCQDVSHAGKRAGLKEGTRTGLWYEFARIIRELRPGWVLAENVPGLLSVDSGRGMGTVLRNLAESGYDAEWDCIPAAAFGAPHLRYRVFIVANAEGERCREEGQLCEQPPQRIASGSQVLAYSAFLKPGQQNTQSGGQDFSPGGRDSRGCEEPGRKALADASRTRLERPWLFGATPDRSHWWAVEPKVGRVAHGIPSRVDRLRCLGNAVVPQLAEWLGRRIVAASR